MSGMGYHYGPCKGGKGWAVIPLGIAAGLIYEVSKHGKGIQQGIEDVFTGLAILAIVMAIASITTIVLVIRAHSPNSIKRYTRVNERVMMEIPSNVDVKDAFRAWLKLDHATQCSPEWDWLTNLNDDNRALAQARLEGKVIEP